MLQLALLSPKTGTEQAFDQWCRIHLIEFVRIPGVSSARRNKLPPVPALGITLLPSTAMYVTYWPFRYIPIARAQSLHVLS